MDSEVDYEAVFNAIVVPSVVLTPDFVIVAVNDALLNVMKRTRADVLGQLAFTVFPDNPGAPNDPAAHAMRASLERVAATGRRNALPMQRYDVEVPGRPGVLEERYWSAVTAPVLGPDGKAKLIIHAVEEVTDFLRQLRGYGEDGVSDTRTALEAMTTNVYARAQELHNLNERLKQTAGQQRHAMAALREAIERQQRFVFDASHDLRNPITALLTELEVALSEPDIDTHEILYKLLRDAERLNEIVADLLELARLDTAAPDAEVELIDLGRFVVEELERRRVTASVHTRIDSEVLVTACRIRLARLLGNLMANAERHTTTTIEVIVTRDPPHAVLEVIDDGPGIAPADRERIFERLRRLDDARHKDPGGSGLGLPIAREIARVYGGHLYAADQPTGARFVLRLPLTA
ncbi:ATP-binding protein [Microbispora rosea]|uniref:sensor histidine kinase n=1 Tax=Microbispora rosea TaxID=58117 RepID=UPI0037B70AC4